MTQTIKKVNNDPYYDINDDWALIVASFQTQYGLRLSAELQDMSWREFAYLINGLSGETPLGRIIAIRAENRPEAIKEMTQAERKIRNEYRNKMALRKSEKETENALEQMKNAFVKLAK